MKEEYSKLFSGELTNVDLHFIERLQIFNKDLLREYKGLSLNYETTETEHGMSDINDPISLEETKRALFKLRTLSNGNI